jgi:hypothetical protein
VQSLSLKDIDVKVVAKKNAEMFHEAIRVESCRGLLVRKEARVLSVDADLVAPDGRTDSPYEALANSELNELVIAVSYSSVNDQVRLKLVCGLDLKKVLFAGMSLRDPLS